MGKNKYYDNGIADYETVIAKGLTFLGVREVMMSDAAGDENQDWPKYPHQYAFFCKHDEQGNMICEPHQSFVRSIKNFNHAWEIGSIVDVIGHKFSIGVFPHELYKKEKIKDSGGAYMGMGKQEYSSQMKVFEPKKKALTLSEVVEELRKMASQWGGRTDWTKYEDDKGRIRKIEVHITFTVV